MYGHIAGHYDEAEDLKVDTPGLMSLSQFGAVGACLPYSRRISDFARA